MRITDLELPVPDMGVATLDSDIQTIFEAHGLKIRGYKFEPLNDEDTDATGRWIIEAEHGARE